MQAYQERVVVERNELSEKLHKLRTFIGSQVYPNLPEAEQGRLSRQHMAMALYWGVLNERIAAFEE
jgi:hypothetical protein